MIFEPPLFPLHFLHSHSYRHAQGQEQRLVLAHCDVTNTAAGQPDCLLEILPRASSHAQRRSSASKIIQLYGLLLDVN